MTFPYILAGISILIWSIVPFRQVHKKYFYYFYFSALIDPLTFYLRFLFHSNSNFFFISCSLLALISIQNKSLIKKYNLLTILFFIIINILFFYLKNSVFILFYSTIHLLLLLTFLKDIVKNISLNKVFNIFIAMLILEESITILKVLGLSSGISNNYFYFYASNAFDLLIGLFFWIKEDNPRLSINLITQ